MGNRRTGEWSKNEIDHEKGMITRLDQPTIASAEVKQNKDSLSKLIKEVADNDQAVFIVLETMVLKCTARLNV